MTPKISLITATLGAALLFAVPAWGDNWAADKSQPATAVSPDWFERAAAVSVQKHEAMLDARERALGVDSQPFDARSEGLNKLYGLGEYSNMLDARERALVEKKDVASSRPVDARSVELNRIYGLGEFAPPVVADDRFTIDHSNVPVSAEAPTTGRDIEWPQIGIGLGLGLASVLLLLAMKATRQRPLAH